MKRIFLVLLLLASNSWAATSQMQNLLPAAAVTADDIFWMVDNPLVTPADRKITANLVRSYVTNGLAIGVNVQAYDADLDALAANPNLYQATNATLTALAANPNLYQATNAALTALANNPNLYQATNAALTALATNPNLYQATNATLTALSTNATLGAGTIMLANPTAGKVAIFDAASRLTNSTIDSSFLPNMVTAPAATFNANRIIRAYNGLDRTVWESVVGIGDTGDITGVNTLTATNTITAGAFVAGATNVIAELALKANAAGSGDDVWVNGTNVIDPNLTNSTTIGWAIAGTNVIAAVADPLPLSEIDVGLLVLTNHPATWKANDLTVTNSIKLVSATASRGAIFDAASLLTNDVAATGTGAPVRATSPVLVTPNIGAAIGASLKVDDDPYAAGWDGSTNVPTKNALYDKIQTLGAGDQTPWAQDIDGAGFGLSGASYLQATNLLIMNGAVTNHPMTAVNAALPPFSADRTGVADATAAIQSAIDYASTNSRGGRVYCPAGYYKITGTLALPNYCHIEGESKQSTAGTYFYKTSAGDMVHLYGTGVVIKHIKFIGDPATAQRGLVTTNDHSIAFTYFLFENITVSSFDTGIDLNWSWVGDILDSTIGSCVDGLVLSNNCNGIRINGGYFTSNTNGITIRGDGCYNNAIRTTFESNQRSILLTNVTQNTVITECHFENQKIQDIWADGAYKLNIHNNGFGNCAYGGTNIYVNASFTPTIANNDFWDPYEDCIWVTADTTEALVTGNYYANGAARDYNILSADYVQIEEGSVKAGTTNVVTALALKAPIAGPTFTGDALAVTPAAADNDTSIATTAYVQTELAGVGSPDLASVIQVTEECFWNQDFESEWKWAGGAMARSGEPQYFFGDASHMGVLRFRSTVTNIVGNASTWSRTAESISIGYGTVDFTWITKGAAASSASQNYTLCRGLGDTALTTNQVDGITFRYNHGAYGGNWQCVTTSNSVSTVSDSGVAYSTAWIKQRAVVNAAGTSAVFYINNTAVATNTTTLPTGRQTGIIWLLDRISLDGTAAAERDNFVDLFDLKITLTTPR